MSAEWVTAIASLGTFVVIAASAAAALLQLRHMRGGNQIAALNEIREALESERFEVATGYVMREFQTRMDEPAMRELLATGASLSGIPEFDQPRMVGNFFENVGLFVRTGIIDREIACNLWANVVLTSWDAMAPFIFNLRAIRNVNALYENFEWLAVMSKRYAARYSNGTYPANFERMPALPLWPEIERSVRQR